MHNSLSTISQVEINVGNCAVDVVYVCVLVRVESELLFIDSKLR